VRSEASQMPWNRKNAGPTHRPTHGRAAMGARIKKPQRNGLVLESGPDTAIRRLESYSWRAVSAPLITEGLRRKGHAFDDFILSSRPSPCVLSFRAALLGEAHVRSQRPPEGQPVRTRQRPRPTSTANQYDDPEGRAGAAADAVPAMPRPTPANTRFDAETNSRTKRSSAAPRSPRNCER